MSSTCISEENSFIVEDDFLKVAFNKIDARITVIEKKSNSKWEQLATTDVESLETVKELSHPQKGLECALRLKSAPPLKLGLRLLLLEDSSDLIVELTPIEDVSFSEIGYPFPFVLDSKDGSLVIPAAQGILLPVNGKTGSCPQCGRKLDRELFNVYGGNGLSMAWYGVADAKRGSIAIFDTPNDAAVAMIEAPEQEILVAHPVWRPSKDRFGYTRRLIYSFLPIGGYVPLAKRYREYAISKGLFKSLREKEKDNPNVAKLIGAPDVWAYVSTPTLCKRLMEIGIEKAVINNLFLPLTLLSTPRYLDETEYLFSRYTVYQDVYLMDDPGDPIQHLHTRTTDDIMVNKEGKLVEGGIWDQRQCYLMCSPRSLAVAKKHLPEATKNLNAVFIDTTAIMPFFECYSPEHPIDRTADRKYKYELLKFAYDQKLVVGTEGGRDWAVPVTHYFEGIMSMQGYKTGLVAPGGTWIYYFRPSKDYWDIVMNEKIRVPLFNLVYHDAVISHWWTGDHYGKMPEFWSKKILFDILYGNPPMFMFDLIEFNDLKEEFKNSYEQVAKIHEAIGYDEMLSHEFLTEDRTVQRTMFSSNTEIIVNFGEKEYKDGDLVVKPKSYLARLPNNKILFGSPREGEALELEPYKNYHDYIQGIHLRYQPKFQY